MSSANLPQKMVMPEKVKGYGHDDQGERPLFPGGPTATCIFSVLSVYSVVKKGMVQNRLAVDGRQVP